MLGTVISQHLATLHELQTIYSYEDAWALFEIALVNNYNKAAMIKAVID